MKSIVNGLLEFTLSNFRRVLRIENWRLLQFILCSGIGTALGWLTWLDQNQSHLDIDVAFDMMPWDDAGFQIPTSLMLVAMGADGEMYEKQLNGYDLRPKSKRLYFLEQLPSWTNKLEISIISPLRRVYIEKLRYRFGKQAMNIIPSDSIHTFGILNEKILDGSIIGERDFRATQSGFIIEFGDNISRPQPEISTNNKSSLLPLLVAVAMSIYLVLCSEVVYEILFTINVTIKKTLIKAQFHECLQCFIAMIFVVTCAMSFGLPINSHADEYLHIAAADYWKKNSLPSYVQSEEILPSISHYGVTYLMDLNVSYIIAGKFSRLLAVVGLSTQCAVRIFNIFLFLIICVVFYNLYSYKRYTLVVLFFPQFWYLFSYYNGDAWCLFCGLCFVLLSWSPLSIIQQTLSGKLYGKEGIRSILLTTFLLFNIVLSKKNHWIFLVYAFIIILYSFYNSNYSVNSRAIVGRAINRTITALITVMLTFILYFAYKQHYFDNESVNLVMEETARLGFRPSDISNNNSYDTLNIRNKGVSIIDMLFQKGFLSQSVLGLFGQYGWLQYYARIEYYYIMGILFSLYTIVIYKSFSTNIKSSNLVLLLSVLGCIILLICLSAWHSWNNDFQPQARYLLPAIPFFIFLELHASDQENYKIKIDIITRIAILSGVLALGCMLIVGMSINNNM